MESTGEDFPITIYNHKTSITCNKQPFINQSYKYVLLITLIIVIMNTQTRLGFRNDVEM